MCCSIRSSDSPAAVRRAARRRAGFIDRGYWPPDSMHDLACSGSLRVGGGWRYDVAGMKAAVEELGVVNLHARETVHRVRAREPIRGLFD
jgi:hypothetical protein